ncbi:hypothetical protein FRB95_011858 [Tulasnella sp. JGI-2019a]|nr:hypothetical protein FRB95_011858 [Tulasnella sp. JGI-2019a]
MLPHRSTLQPPDIVPAQLRTTSGSLNHALHPPSSISDGPSQTQHMNHSQITTPYDSQPQAGSSTSTGIHPPTSDDPAAGKRKRGRPKGSKTKTKRADTTYVPIESTIPSQEIAITGNDNDYTHDGVPSGAVESLPRMGSFSEPGRISDGPTYGLSVASALASSAPGPSTGTSSDLPATLPEAIPQVDTTNNASSSSSIQNFYDFQCQVISLCSVFYESAGDLVRRTDPAVLAQSFQLGSRQDPMVLLQNAKDFCDGLLANPESFQEQSLPPPTPESMFPVALQPLASASSVGVQPQLGIMPPPSSYATSQSNQGAGTSGIHHDVQSQMHGSPTTPIGPPSSHMYGGIHPHSIHSGGTQPSASTSGPQGYSPSRSTPSHHAPPPHQLATSASPSSSTSPLVSNFTGVTSHGAWSNEDTERLKSLAEQSKSRSSDGEIDWEWTTSMFGETRSRHQILIKAVNLGLKRTGTHPSRLRKRISMGNASEASTSGSTSMFHGASGAFQSQQASAATIQEGQVQRFIRESMSSPQLRQSATGGFHIRAASQPQGMAPDVSPSASVTPIPPFPSQSDQNPYLPQQPLRPPVHRRLSGVSMASSYQSSPNTGSIAIMQPPQTTSVSTAGSFHGQMQGYVEHDQSQPQLQPQLSPQPHAQPSPSPFAPFHQARSNSQMMQAPAQPVAAPGPGMSQTSSPHMYQRHSRNGSGTQRPTSSSSASSTSRAASHHHQQQHNLGVGQPSSMTSPTNLMYQTGSMQQNQMQMPMQPHAEASQQHMASPRSARRQGPPTLRRVGPSFGPGQALPQYFSSSEYGGSSSGGMVMGPESLIPGNGGYHSSVTEEAVTQQQQQQAIRLHQPDPRNPQQSSGYQQME